MPSKRTYNYKYDSDDPYVYSGTDDLFSKLESEDYLKGLSRENFVERMAFYISEINALHPFREGNGRAQRIFANQLARQAGWNLNLTAVTPERLCDAYIASMSDLSDLVALLDETVTAL